MIWQRIWNRLLWTALATEAFSVRIAAAEPPTLVVPKAAEDDKEPDPAPLLLPNTPPGPAEPTAPSSSADALGFGEPVVSAPPPPPPPQEWSVYGTIRSDWALWTERIDSNPFAKSRQSLDLNVRFKKSIFRLVLSGHAEYDFAYLYKNDTYDAPTQNVYAWQLFPREAFAALSLPSFELAVGYQVVPWGHGELLSPLDVAMPRDQREPGLQDPGDLRLPVLSSRINYFRGVHSVEFMMIHLPAFGFRPTPNSLFSPVPALFSTPQAVAVGLSPDLLIGRSYDETSPTFNQQFLLRYAYHGPRVDLGVYAGTVLDQRGVFATTDASTFLASTTLGLQHERFGILGTSGNLPLRWFLLNWELSSDLARMLNTGQFDSGNVSTDRAYLINTMVGLSFTGVRDLRLSVEFLKPWVLNDRTDWLLVPDRPVFAARASYSLFRERLQFNVVASFIGFHLEQGWFLRGEGSFMIRDGLKVNAGYITYQPGSEFSTFFGLGLHDRFYAGLRWDFTLL